MPNFLAFSELYSEIRTFVKRCASFLSNGKQKDSPIS